MMKMSSAERAKLLKELFATDGNAIGVSYILISIGASDLNSFVFSYNDLPEGETDFTTAQVNEAPSLQTEQIAHKLFASVVYQLLKTEELHYSKKSL